MHACTLGCPERIKTCKREGTHTQNLGCPETKKAASNRIKWWDGVCAWITTRNFSGSQGPAQTNWQYWGLKTTVFGSYNKHHSVLQRVYQDKLETCLMFRFSHLGPLSNRFPLIPTVFTSFKLKVFRIGTIVQQIEQLSCSSPTRIQYPTLHVVTGICQE